MCWLNQRKNLFYFLKIHYQFFLRSISWKWLLNYQINKKLFLKSLSKKDFLQAKFPILNYFRFPIILTIFIKFIFINFFYFGHFPKYYQFPNYFIISPFILLTDNYIYLLNNLKLHNNIFILQQLIFRPNLLFYLSY